MKNVFWFFLYTTVLMLPVFGQTANTCRYERGGFSIRLPAMTCPTPEEGDGPTDMLGSEVKQDVIKYKVIQEDSITRNFMVYVIDARNIKLSKKDRQERLKGADFIIGGDDATPTSIRSYNLTKKVPVREYVYKKGIVQGIYARGQVIDAGDFVYILSFRTTSAKDLFSKAAADFFGSFVLVIKPGAN